MPPLLREWVPEGHLVWTVLDAVGEMDLGAFYVSYHADGHGRPAYDPSMMVASLPYAYPRGTRSPRGIERACVEDVACRVICSNLVLDHSTIAEFRVRYEDALAELFNSVLLLCRKAGWSGSAWLLSMGQGSGRTPRARPIAAMSRSRARSWPRRRRRTGARTSFMARRAAMSCRSGWPRARGGGPRCARPGRSSNASVRGSTARRGRREPGRPRLWRSGSTRRFVARAHGRRARGAGRSRSGARWRRGRSRGRGPSGSGSRHAGWRRSLWSSTGRTWEPEQHLHGPFDLYDAPISFFEPGDPRGLFLGDYMGLETIEGNDVINFFASTISDGADVHALRANHPQ
jgi:transposase